jgi:hypothetical protein
MMQDIKIHSDSIDATQKETAIDQQ